MQNDKILFLAHPTVSHAHDTFYNGCLQLFRDENVFDYPIAKKYHSDHRNQHNYFWWCHSNNQHTSSLSLGQWITKINNNEIDYVIGNNRAIDLFIEVLKQINNPSCKIIFIEEEHDRGFEVHRTCIESLRPYYDKIDIHYKMDYIAERVCPYNKIFPFYMSGPKDKLLYEIGKFKPFEERQYDVCYITGPSHPKRKMYHDILKNTLSKGNNILECGAHKYNLNQYFNLINDSKIFISAQGNEWSNTRNIEGPILGCALFTEKIEISIPFEYTDGINAVFFNEENLVPKLTEYLNDTEKLKTLAYNSHKHAMEYHTTVARAKQMVDLVKKIK